MRSLVITSLIVLAGSLDAAGAAPTVERLSNPPEKLQPLTMRIVGRAINESPTTWQVQWPGVYAEAAFDGTEVFVPVGSEARIQHLLVDGTEIAKQVRPEAGTYRIAGLPAGKHVVRLEIASENQGGPVTLDAFATRKTDGHKKVAAAKRQIEFIGDSHTVGYGNTSPKRECTQDEVWATTDTSQTFGHIVAQHYQADYEINAISGRGIVRNYGGFIADPLTIAYPFALFDKSRLDTDNGWQPTTVVISLGTNDFSTPLNPDEKWHTREELHADYERTYDRFLNYLRGRYPQALFVLWATDLSEGEIQTEVKKVVDTRAANGDARVVFLPVNGLEMSGCDWHPSVEDDRTIARKLIETIDAHPPPRG